MEVKIFDLARDHRSIQTDLLEAAGRIFSKGEFILGGEVQTFEEAFARYTGTRYAVAVGSGTDAIKIAGLAMELEAGDKIVTTPNTYIATVMSLSLHGIEPVFCDIEPDTYTMNPDHLKEILADHDDIKVCIPVHLYGHPCRIGDIISICAEHGVTVMEDACQAHGALYEGRKVGTFGDTSAFSFYPTKNLGAYGDAGILLTNASGIDEAARMLRNHGQSQRHVHALEGFNSRLDDIQAAFLNTKLPHLDEWNRQRRTIAQWYARELTGLPVVLPVEKEWAYHVYHLYVIRTTERNDLQAFLGKNGVTSLIHYPTPVHLQPCYRYLGLDEGSYPEAEKAAEEILSLPMYPSLTEEEVVYVCETIRAFYRT